MNTRGVPTAPTEVSAQSFENCVAYTYQTSWVDMTQARLGLYMGSLGSNSRVTVKIEKWCPLNNWVTVNRINSALLL